MWTHCSNGPQLTDHSGASCQRSPGASVEVVHGNRSHEGQLEVGVSINATCRVGGAEGEGQSGRGRGEEQSTCRVLRLCPSTWYEVRHAVAYLA